jgi:predicted nuclease with TOPRIM domain
MSKDDEYMHEISRLEGERDYWRSTHAKTDAEGVRLRAKLDELLAELEIRMAWRLTKSLDERTRERDEARRAARQLYDLWPAEYFETLGGIVESFPWIESVDRADSVSVPSA